MATKNGNLQKYKMEDTINLSYYITKRRKHNLQKKYPIKRKIFHSYKLDRKQV